MKLDALKRQPEFSLTAPVSAGSQHPTFTIRHSWGTVTYATSLLLPHSKHCGVGSLVPDASKLFASSSRSLIREVFDPAVTESFGAELTVCLGSDYFRQRPWCKSGILRTVVATPVHTTCAHFVCGFLPQAGRRTVTGSKFRFFVSRLVSTLQSESQVRFVYTLRTNEDHHPRFVEPAVLERQINGACMCGLGLAWLGTAVLRVLSGDWGLDPSPVCPLSRVPLFAQPCGSQKLRQRPVKACRIGFPCWNSTSATFCWAWTL
jgi:hypothetical protein